MKKGIVEIKEDTRIGNIILEKGDKIRILKEDHFKRFLGPDFSSLTTEVYSDKGSRYLATDLANLFMYMSEDWADVDYEVSQLFRNLSFTASKQF